MISPKQAAENHAEQLVEDASKCNERLRVDISETIEWINKKLSAGERTIYVSKNTEIAYLEKINEYKYLREFLLYKLVESPSFERVINDAYENGWILYVEKKRIFSWEHCYHKAWFLHFMERKSL